MFSLGGVVRGLALVIISMLRRLFVFFFSSQRIKKPLLFIMFLFAEPLQGRD
jgi:hypothetical protein